MKRMPLPPNKSSPPIIDGSACHGDETDADSSNLILISPIGEVNKEACRYIEKKIQTIFNFKTATIPVLSDISFAYNENRKQYHSTPILQSLADHAPSHCLKIVGIATVDLFIPILTHVYGEAQLGGKACIISTFRLHSHKDTESIFLLHERMAKEVIHELGHTFNLRHCDSHRCIMHYCRSIQDVDAKSNQLCRYCSVLLNDEIKVLA